MQAAAVWCKNTRLGAGSGLAPALCWESGAQRRGRSDWPCCTGGLCPAKFVSERSWETCLPLSTTLPEYADGTSRQVSSENSAWSKSWVVASFFTSRTFLICSLKDCLGLLLAHSSVWRLDDVSFPESAKRHLAHFRVWQAEVTSVLGYCRGQDTQVIALISSVWIFGV